jgi:hypothetical protein
MPSPTPPTPPTPHLPRLLPLLLLLLFPAPPTPIMLTVTSTLPHPSQKIALENSGIPALSLTKASFYHLFIFSITLLFFIFYH